MARGGRLGLPKALEHEQHDGYQVWVNCFEPSLIPRMPIEEGLHIPIYTPRIATDEGLDTEAQPATRVSARGEAQRHLTQILGRCKAADAAQERDERGGLLARVGGRGTHEAGDAGGSDGAQVETMVGESGQGVARRGPREDAIMGQGGIKSQGGIQDQGGERKGVVRHGHVEAAAAAAAAADGAGGGGCGGHGVAADTEAAGIVSTRTQRRLRVGRCHELPGHERCVALAMGRHELLGAASCLQALPGELIQALAEEAAPWPRPWRPGSAVGAGVVRLLGGGACAFGPKER
jgi:hypothetical protein